MKFLVIVAAVVSSVQSAPQSEAPVSPFVYSSRYHIQDELGRVSYGFAHPGQTKFEERDQNGNVRGAYSYVDNEGKNIVVQYTAGKDGFRVNTNALPGQHLAYIPSITKTKNISGDIKKKESNINNSNKNATVKMGTSHETTAINLFDTKNSQFGKKTKNKVMEAQSNVLSTRNEEHQSEVSNAQKPKADLNSVSSTGNLIGSSVSVPVTDTPEVTKAKAEFFKQFQSAKLNSRTSKNKMPENSKKLLPTSPSVLVLPAFFHSINGVPLIIVPYPYHN